jgi:hypothetical protein
VAARIVLALFSVPSIRKASATAPGDPLAVNAPSMLQAVDHYDSCKSLGLTSQEKNDLVEYLMTL